jgi:flagellar hook assembly protein FlgD
MQLALGAARRRAERSPTILVAILAAVLIATLTGSTATVLGANRHARGASARTADAPAPKKAVIVAGPVGSDTAKFVGDANDIADAAEAHGMEVIRIFTPHATWQRVVDAANGADLFVYIGHGNGWPSPHVKNPETKNGLGLNPYDNSGNTTTKYYGAEQVINNIHLAPNAIVLLNHLCYSAGNGEGGTAIPTRSTAIQRVDNFAHTFLEAGARTVFALRIQPGENLVNSLFNNHTTMDGFFMSTFGGNSDGTYLPYYGWVGDEPNLYFDSDRTPGARIHLDPDHAVAGEYPGWSSRFGYTRAVTGDLGLTTDEWLGGSSSTDNVAPVVQHLAAGQSADTIPAGENAPPVFTPNGDGLSDVLTVNHDLSEPSYLDISVARQDGAVVKKFTTWSNEGATRSTWDGRNSNGKVVPDGKYDITVKPKDRAGNVGAAVTTTVKLLTAIKSPTLAPTLFFPGDGDLLARTSTMSVTVRKPATIRWRITGSNGDLVRLGIDDQAFDPGVATWDWDGLDNSGAPVPEGLYTSIVSATTDVGTYSHKLNVRVGPFFLKGSLKVTAGQKVKLTLLTAEPMKGYPKIEIRQPGVAVYHLYLTKYSSTKFGATWKVKAGAAGTIRVTVSGTDTGGGVQSHVYTGTLR